MSDVAFQEELRALLNRHSRESGSNTPDYILAQYLVMCLAAWEQATNARDEWYEKLVLGPREAVS